MIAIAGRRGRGVSNEQLAEALLAALTGDINIEESFVDIERTVAGCVSVELSTDDQFQPNDHPRAAVQAVRLAGGTGLWMEQGQEGEERVLCECPSVDGCDNNSNVPHPQRPRCGVCVSAE